MLMINNDQHRQEIDCRRNKFDSLGLDTDNTDRVIHAYITSDFKVIIHDDIYTYI